MYRRLFAVLMLAATAAGAVAMASAPPTGAVLPAQQTVPASFEPVVLPSATPQPMQFDSPDMTPRISQPALVAAAAVAASATPRATSKPTPRPAPRVVLRVQPVQAPARVPSVATARAYARARIGSTQFQCLDRLWARESGWRTTAVNRSSGAYGIPQALPGWKMAAAGWDWRYNPVTQVKWGLAYIAGRYATACAALAHLNSAGWY